MSARDELAFILRQNRMPWVTNTEHREMEEHQAAVILASGYSKPIAVTTDAELEALPVGSVIRTSGIDFLAQPRVAVKTGIWRNKSEWQIADSDEWVVSSDELDDLPAIVLYTPKES